MSTHWQDNIPHIVVLNWRDLFSAILDHDFVSNAAILFLIMTMEFVIAHGPETELSIESVSRYKNLNL